MPAPGVVGYGPGYPMNTPGYNYNTYSGSVAPNGTPVNPYLGAVSIWFFSSNFQVCTLQGPSGSRPLNCFLGSWIFQSSIAKVATEILSILCKM
jgi:hypothetical protein